MFETKEGCFPPRAHQALFGAFLWISFGRRFRPPTASKSCGH